MAFHSSKNAGVPYFNLKRQYHLLKKDYQKALEQVFDSGQFILGSVVDNFENAFSKAFRIKHSIGVASGTDALILAIRALGIGKGDEVILPSYTYSATAFGVLHNQATPVFVDIDETTYTIDPHKIEKAITKKTKAILPVHLYGQTANMTDIMKIAKKHNLKVIEDTAQAHGATWKGRFAGTFGDFGCFSFYPTKNLGAFGDGGMVTTSQSSLKQKIQIFRNLGHIRFQDDHEEVGWTSRLDAIQAAFLQIKLNHLHKFNQKRQAIAARYRTNLKRLPIFFPAELKEAPSVYHLMVIRVPAKNRDRLRSYLANKGITTLIHYKTPAHLQPGIQKYVARKFDLPVTEKVTREILSLPMFPEMRFDEVDQVCDCIKEYFKN